MRASIDATTASSRLFDCCEPPRRKTDGGLILPRRRHIDRRAHSLAAAPNDDDERPMTTPQAADWLGVSVQFLEIARHKGDGPEFVRLGPKSIRYMPSALRKWCEERAFTHTKQYAGK